MLISDGGMDMAKTKPEEVVQEVKVPVVNTPVYSYDELVEGYKRFGVQKECVMAALRYYKGKEMSVDAAKEIIDKWMRKVIV